MTRLQDLDRRDALLALAVHRFVSQDLGLDWQNSSLLIALSGGLDSTALLSLIHILGTRFGFRLCAAHLDHGLRSESGQDAAACADLCAGLGVPFFCEKADVATEAKNSGQGLEEAGRRLRYAFLERIRRQTGSDWLLTAHQADDLAEDILLRLIRGTSWPALGGMKALDIARRLLRPLLMTDRTDLEAFLRRQGLGWREDKSNQSRDFRRNRIRLDILPLLKKENPAFADVARNLWHTARLDESDWERRLASLAVRTEDGIWLSAAHLDTLCPADRLRAFAQAIKMTGAGQARARTLFQMENAWSGGRRHRQFLFPGGLRARLSPQGVIFEK